MSAVDDSRSYFFAGAVSGVLKVVLSSLAVAAALPMLVRYLGLHDYGTWAALGFFLNLAIALDLGLSRAIVFMAAKDRMQLPGLVAAGLVLSAVVAALLAAGTWLLFATGNLQVGAADDRSSSWLAVAGTLILVSSMVTSVLRGALEARLQISLVNWGFLLQTALVYGSAVVAAAAGAHVNVVVIVTGLCYALVGLLHALVVYADPAARGGTLQRAVIARLLRTAFHMFVIGAPTLLVAPLIQYLLLRTTDSSQYGLFDIAYRIAMVATTAVASIATPLFSFVATLDRDDLALLLRHVKGHLAITTSIFVLGALTFAMFGRQLLELWIGVSDPALFEATLLLLCGLGGMSAVEPITRACMGTGRLRSLLIIRVLLLATTVGAMYALPQIASVQRFALAYALGCAVGIAATLRIFFTWRTSPKSGGGVRALAGRQSA